MDEQGGEQENGERGPNLVQCSISAYQFKVYLSLRDNVNFG